MSTGSHLVPLEWIGGRDEEFVRTGAGVGLDDPQRSLPTLAMLCCADGAACLGRRSLPAPPSDRMATATGGQA